MYSSSRRMSASISGAGRCQFSWLNAKSVSTPDLGIETALDHFAHRRHPGGVAERTRERAPLAHRPLPSMMMAMWAGTAPWTLT